MPRGRPQQTRHAARPSRTESSTAGYIACEAYQRERSETSAKRAKRYYDMLQLQTNKDKIAQACTLRCRPEY